MNNLMIDNIECQLSELSSFKGEEANKFLLDDLKSVNSKYSEFIQTIRFAVSKTGQNGGLMWVDSKGGELLKNSNGKYIGNIAKENGSVGGGIAELTPFAIDPNTLLVMASTAIILQDLNEIKHIQHELYDYIKANDEGNLKGDLYFLMDLFEKININYDDSNYIDSVRPQLVEIIRISFENIEKYKNHIKDNVSKRKLVHFQGDVNKKTQNAIDYLSKYQLSIYMYSLSQYLLIRVNNSAKRDYLDKILEKIEKFRIEYNEVFDEAHNALCELLKTSGEQLVLSGVSSVEKMAGNLLKKIPVAKDKEIDKFFIDQSKKTNNYKENVVDQLTQQIETKKELNIKSFIDGIQLMRHVCNDDIQIGIDSNYLYITN